MKKSKYIYYRIKIMSIKEILFRAKDIVLNCFEYSIRSFIRHPYSKNIKKLSPIPFLANLDREFSNLHAPEFMDNVQDIINGKLLFQGQYYELGNPIDWHYDPHSQTKLPLLRGRKYYSLNIYSKANIGLIRFINRHTYLVYLSIYVGMKGDEAKYLKGYIRNWIAKNPYLEGINWSDSWQVGARVINWCLILSFAYNELKKDQEFIKEMSASIIDQAIFIQRHPAKYSSANNHLLLETLACAFVVLLFPLSEYTKKNSLRIMKTLEEEVIRQYYNDGFHREQSVTYHWYTLEYLFLFIRSANALGVNIPRSILDKITKSFEALYLILPDKGAVPQLGDGGFENTYNTFYLFQPEINQYHSLLQQAGIYFERDDWIRNTQFDPKCALLFGGRPYLSKGSCPNFNETRQLFDAGYLIYSGHFDNGVKYRVIFDTGPFGLSPTFAHSHADALNIIVDINCEPFLIDSGTYDYHPQDKKWRSYFRGTSAHNTVTVDDLDQAVPGGDMLWLNEPKTTLVKNEEEEGIISIQAEHNGYLRLYDPVMHRREVVIDKLLNRILIVDELQCKGKHKVSINFHIDKNIKISRGASHNYYFDNNALKVEMKSCLADKVSLKKGLENPPLGWYSPSHGYKIPVNVVCIEDKILGSFKHITEFTIHNLDQL